MEIITSRDLAENRGWRRRRPVPQHQAPRPTQLDCGSCRAPASACSDCVVSVLLAIDAPQHPTSDAADLTADELRAVAALQAGGLLPPLRHVAAS